MLDWREHTHDYLIAERGCDSITWCGLHILDRELGTAWRGRPVEEVAKLLNTHVILEPVEFTFRVKGQTAWQMGTLVGWYGDEIWFELKRIVPVALTPAHKSHPEPGTRQEIEEKFGLYFWPKIIPHRYGRYADLLDEAPPQPKQKPMFGRPKPPPARDLIRDYEIRKRRGLL